MNKQEFKKMRRSLGTSMTYLNIQIIGVPEAEEQQQETENLFEQIMKENFPKLAKKIAPRKSRKLRGSKEIGPKEKHTKAHHQVTQD